ncbi:hypothetical protein DPMN_165204 [Dreissena polymorpha]|uniref:Uncharacterized protein n=1 Tax=Dreissena polymorpha TaxID=45954 RepID=A0A9D4IUE0_DREPO|nr:hypothetical protein DPMN_165204 [Dreissena polymorpha]
MRHNQRSAGHGFDPNCGSVHLSSPIDTGSSPRKRTRERFKYAVGYLCNRA